MAAVAAEAAPDLFPHIGYTKSIAADLAARQWGTTGGDYGATIPAPIKHKQAFDRLASAFSAELQMILSNFTTADTESDCLNLDEQVSLHLRSFRSEKISKTAQVRAKTRTAGDLWKFFDRYEKSQRGSLDADFSGYLFGLETQGELWAFFGFHSRTAGPQTMMLVSTAFRRALIQLVGPTVNRGPVLNVQQTALQRTLLGGNSGAGAGGQITLSLEDSLVVCDYLIETLGLTEKQTRAVFTGDLSLVPSVAAPLVVQALHRLRAS